jgi:2-amino-4-hydroxy-6-hydroxymethyldihydropteridine diphosphokinase
MTAHRAYIGIGTNLGNRLENVDRAVAALRELGTLRTQSSLYRTAPWGNRRQPWFLNAVVLLETALSPHDVLERLQAIEATMGRERAAAWGPRVIDLDLLLYDDLEIAMPDLKIPHPRMNERAFVLVPLSEIDASFEALRDTLQRSELAGVERVERESIAAMTQTDSRSASERVRALARFLAETDVVRVRISRGDEDIEVAAPPHHARRPSPTDEREPVEAPAPRVDTIKANLVGIFHVSRPAPIEGELFDEDRELGYIEALGIRTAVHSMGAGRFVSVATEDGTAVEYGQPLFTVARTR